MTIDGNLSQLDHGNCFSKKYKSFLENSMNFCKFVDICITYWFIGSYKTFQQQETFPCSLGNLCPRQYDPGQL